MANRALASEFLGRLAQRRYDFTTALARADRAAQAGEDYVRFNPSDLGAWQYLVRGREQQAEYLVETGRITRALETLRATVALENDARRPSSLAPILMSTWFQLQDLEARLGQRDASQRSLTKATEAVDETLLTIDERRKPLTVAFSRLGRARQAFRLGDFRAATRRRRGGGRSRRAGTAQGDAHGLQMIREFALANALQIAADAALHAGDAREAEAFARRRAGMLSESMTARRTRASTRCARARYWRTRWCCRSGRPRRAPSSSRVEVLRIRRAQLARET
jgi:tetratricopeptide (TPR) repeat protein